MVPPPLPHPTANHQATSPTSNSSTPVESRQTRRLRRHTLPTTTATSQRAHSTDPQHDDTTPSPTPTTRRVLQLGLRYLALPANGLVVQHPNNTDSTTDLRLCTSSSSTPTTVPHELTTEIPSPTDYLATRVDLTNHTPAAHTSAAATASHHPGATTTATHPAHQNPHPASETPPPRPTTNPATSTDTTLCPIPPVSDPPPQSLRAHSQRPAMPASHRVAPLSMPHAADRPPSHRTDPHHLPTQPRPPAG
jgi:hypothetical protein